jgi:hypothetical protein
VEIETKLGKLAVPADEVRHIDFGFRLSDDDARKLDQALRDLGSDRYQARDLATRTLTGMGRLAYPALLDAGKGADLEKTKRVQAILQTVRGRVPAERLQFRRTDVIRTTDSVVAGRITASTLRVRSELFGEVTVPVFQLRELRALQAGGEVVVALDAARHGTRTGWLETDLEVTGGARLEITATGEINLDPGNAVGNPATRPVGPDGTMQLTSSEEFPPGKLVGRVGADGPAFAVGSRYSGTPGREGKLYLRVATIEHANNVKAAGTYQVRITAEPN